MKPWLRGICAVLAVMVVLGAASARGQVPLEAVPLEKVEAKAILLQDARSGETIFAQNEDTELPIASITKVMSLILILDAVDEGRLAMDEMVTISKAAAAVEGSNALLDAGHAYSVADLVKSVIVSSANDATYALAERVSGSESAFVDRMNARAKDMGLTQTVFANCTGLPDPAAHSTAWDVAILSRKLLGYPAFSQYSGIWLDQMKHKNGRVSDMVNTNRLVRFFEGTTGVKTGSTSEAGYCIAASAKRGDMELIAVILGAPTAAKRFALAQEALSYGFDHYKVTQPVTQGDVLREQVVVKGRGRVDVVAGDTLRILQRKDDPREVEWILEMPQELTGPIADGQSVGRIVGLLGNDERVEADVVAKGELTSPTVADGIRRILAGWMWW